MKEIKLSQTGAVARIDLLGGPDLADVLTLQDKACAALPTNMKSFLAPQAMTAFQNLLTRQNGVMIGIRANNILIAQMALMGPLPLRDAVQRQAVSFNNISFHHAKLNDNIVIFCKSLAVHPDWRGNGLAQNLVAFALELPVAQVAAHVFVQVAAANKRDRDAFIKQGFGIVAAVYDVKDGLPRFVMQKPAFGFDFENEIIVDGGPSR